MSQVRELVAAMSCVAILAGASTASALTISADLLSSTWPTARSRMNAVIVHDANTIEVSLTPAG